MRDHQLENMKAKTRKELKEMSLVIHQEFERLQHQKETEIRSILVSFAKIHATYCEQVGRRENIENDGLTHLSDL